jgi:F-type H+-transporting ATPase subunit delta
MAAFVARYAYALADVVTKEKLNTEDLERQINDFLATWDASAELREIFANPVVAAEQKIAILDKLNVQLEMQKELRNLLAVLIRNGRISRVHEVAEAYRAEMQSRLGIRQVEIVTARALSEQERSELTTGVGKLAGSPIAACFKLDASILGGTVVRIGSTVFDGSVRGRLERLKEALIAG